MISIGTHSPFLHIPSDTAARHAMRNAMLDRMHSSSVVNRGNSVAARNVAHASHIAKIEGTQSAPIEHRGGERQPK